MYELDSHFSNRISYLCAFCLCTGRCVFISVSAELSQKLTLPKVSPIKDSNGADHGVITSTNTIYSFAVMDRLALLLLSALMPQHHYCHLMHFTDPLLGSSMWAEEGQIERVWLFNIIGMMHSPWKP